MAITFRVPLLILFLAASFLPAYPLVLDDEPFPGWKGESHHVAGRYTDLAEVTLKEQLQGGLSEEQAANSEYRDDSALRQERDTGIDPFSVTQVAQEPRAFVYKHFLTPEECDHLVELARNKLRESMVADNNSGQGLKSNVRTSSGMFIQQKDDVVRRVEQRLADWTMLPVENGEAIQVLRYEDGQKYDAHFDYFHDKVNTQLGGHRYATVLMYLSDVEEGGETVFPSSQLPQGYNVSSFSPCAQRGIAVKPRKGDALLFYSLHLDGTTDEHSLHAGCPVIKGEKWSATKWIHVGSFEARTLPSGCADLHPSCAEWAAMGECSKNPVYMVGEGGHGGHCKKSCKKC